MGFPLPLFLALGAGATLIALGKKSSAATGGSSSGTSSGSGSGGTSSGSGTSGSGTSGSSAGTATGGTVPATHTVVAGETPSGIAIKYTGNWANYVELLRANTNYPLNADKTNFKNFWVGMVLKIPDRWRTAYSTPVVSGSAALIDEAVELTDYLRGVPRYKENQQRVKNFQKAAGKPVTGLYGPCEAMCIADCGVVPIVPFYWSRKDWQGQKREYADCIYQMQDTYPDQDWTSAINGDGLHSSVAVSGARARVLP